MAVSGRTLARGGALTLAAVCTTAALVRVDRPGLPPASPTEWATWLSHTAVPDLVLALLRVAATGLAVYAAIATAAALLAALVPGNRIASIAGSIVPRSIEGLTGIAVGAGLLSTLGGQLVGGSGIATAGAASALAPTTTRARALPAASSSPPAVAPSTVVPTPPPTLTAPARPLAPAVAPAVTATPAAPALAPQVHIVGRGDHLWAIAHDTLEDAIGRAPNEVETSAYWHRLIDQNRSRLVDPDNPDLIFAGQELILPTI